ncbi:MAG: RidA family protein, partial [Pseudomonadota bacterium]
MIADKLKELGIDLPDAPAPAANYVPAVLTGNLLYISGQIPVKDGAMVATGHLGKDVSVEQGQAAARQCAINILAQVKTALEGDLERIERCVKLTGFVSSTPDFTQHPQVIN